MTKLKFWYSRSFTKKKHNMVNIFEIELGNLFWHHDGVFRVDYMGPKREGYALEVRDFFIDSDGEESYRQSFNEWIDPLPITKDLLRQLGFEKSGDVMYHSVKKEISVKYYRVDGWVIKRYDQHILSFKSINELQNLFYHLAKTKLTLCK